MKNCLLIIDRDGTIIRDKKYLGKLNDWKTKINLIEKTIFLIKAIDVIFPENIKIVFTNQTGVALGYLTEERVREVNSYVELLLQTNGVEIDHWIYSPEADKDYADKKKIPTNKYIKRHSTRKPNPLLLKELLTSIKLSLNSFQYRIVIGDSLDDKELAKNIKANYIDCSQ